MREILLNTSSITVIILDSKSLYFILSPFLKNIHITTRLFINKIL